VLALLSGRYDRLLWGLAAFLVAIMVFSRVLELVVRISPRSAEP
jgi:hypothetical protein